MTKEPERQKRKLPLANLLFNGLLCSIGVHDWEEKRTIEWEMDGNVLNFYNCVCQNCGKYRSNPTKVTVD